MSNKSAGTAFEREMAVILHDNGFWVHRVQDNPNGQPCDLIAAKDGKTYLFDCKNCEDDSFDLNRMEENQLSAMEAFRKAGNSIGIFAVRFRDTGQVWLFDYITLQHYREEGRKRILSNSCVGRGIRLEIWLNLYNGEWRK